MSEQERARFVRDHQIMVIIFMVAVGILVWGVAFWRAQSSTTTTHRLCIGIKVLLGPQVLEAHTPRTEAYYYYFKHKQALARLDKFYKDLPC